MNDADTDLILDWDKVQDFNQLKAVVRSMTSAMTGLANPEVKYQQGYLNSLNKEECQILKSILKEKNT